MKFIVKCISLETTDWLSALKYHCKRCERSHLYGQPFPIQANPRIVNNVSKSSCRPDSVNSGIDIFLSHKPISRANFIPMMVCLFRFEGKKNPHQGVPISF